MPAPALGGAHGHGVSALQDECDPKAQRIEMNTRYTKPTGTKPDQWTVGFDILCKFTGTTGATATQNLGSFSVQPFPGSQSYIALARWTDPNTAANWNADYVWFDVVGTQLLEEVPDPGFQNLLTEHWYRWCTTFDLDTNEILTVSITDLTSGVSATHNPVGRYMVGGAGGAPTPTGFRYFGGGSAVSCMAGTCAGNTLAFDNLSINEGQPGCEATVAAGGCCQCDGEDQFCTTETEEDCATLGGEYLGDNSACGDCGDAFPEQCPGGCCQCDGEDQFCTIETEQDCAALGGEFLGSGTSCGDCGDAFPEQCLAPQTLIIKGGACPAPVNPGSNGVTPKVLVGAEDFDAGDVDVSSLALSRCDGVGGSVAPNDGPPGPPGAQVKDLNHPNPDPATCETGGCTCNDDQSSDGIDDLKLQFNTDEMDAALNLSSEAAGTILTLLVTGELNDGSSFSASDCIRIVNGGGGASGELSVGSNLPGVWVDVTPLDDTFDEGGYTAFNRAYPQTSEVTVTGPVVPYDYQNWVLANIWIDGVRHAAGNGTVQVTIEATNSVVLQYRRTRFNPGTTPGIGGNSQQW